MVSAFFVDELQAGTPSDMTFGQVVLKTKKLMALSGAISNELLQDTVIDYLGILAEQIIYSIAQKIDNSVLNGVAGDTVNFKGLLVPATAVPSVTASGTLSALTAKDFSSLITPLTKADAINAKYVLSRYADQVVRDLKTTQGFPIYSMPNAVEPANIYGYGKVSTEFAPGIADAATASKNVILFGDLKKYFLGIRLQEMTLDIDTSTYFDKYASRFRMVWRMAGNPARISAFRVLKTPAAQG
jgi:HK97 family phage major capsid protein